MVSHLVQLVLMVVEGVRQVLHGHRGRVLVCASIDHVEFTWHLLIV